CSNVTVSYCGTAAGWSNVWKLLSTDCPADSLIGASVSDTTTCANLNWTFTFNNLAAGTYYLPVPNFGFGQGGGAYSINVNATTCTVGIPESNAKASWTLYPNPATGAITLAFGPDQGTGRLKIMDLTGRVLIEKTVSTSGNMQLELGDKVAPGQYLVEVSTAQGRSVQRLVLR
ncbi:MAG: T9SS type A sorting domain-containing protein, partial [Bacteroidetes bacterium]|nr:T9SS type A sorting domain-containing protein [Bacteroidota bacterium]